jgi:hypothetical protein
MGLAIGAYDKEAGVPDVRVQRGRRSLRGGLVVSSGVALSIALAGCGGGVARPATAKTSAIAFSSPALTGRTALTGGVAGAGRSISARYTCDGADISPSFKWGAVPANTAALALFLLKVERSTQTGGGRISAQVQVEWAVVVLSPGVHEIPAGKLPRGAVVASSSYRICPARGQAATTYIFQLAALPQRPVVGPHFDATKLFQAAEGSAVATGTLTSSYKRA